MQNGVAGQYHHHHANSPLLCGDQERASYAGVGTQCRHGHLPRLEDEEDEQSAHAKSCC